METQKQKELQQQALKTARRFRYALDFIHIYGFKGQFEEFCHYKEQEINKKEYFDSFEKDLAERISEEWDTFVGVRSSNAAKEIWQIFEPLLDLSQHSNEERNLMRVGIAAIIANESFNKDT